MRKRLRVVIEAAEGREAFVERALAGMAERRMAEIVGERQRLGEILVETKPPRQRARHLRHFERMGEPGAVMVALVEHEDLRLVLQSPERGRVDDAVAIAAKGAAARARGLGMKPAAAQVRIARIERAGRCRVHRRRPVPAGLWPVSARQLSRVAD